MFTPHRTSTHNLRYYRYDSIMVTTNMCNNPSNDLKNDDSSVGVLHCVLIKILNDKNVSIPTEGNSTCLKLAGTMVKLFGSPTVKCKEFRDWFITTLQDRS